MITNYGLFSDTYSSLTGTGLSVGMTKEVPNTPNVKMLVQNDSGGTLADGAALKFTTPASFLVAADASAAIPVIGIQDNVGGTVAVNLYFWASIEGFCYPLVATGTSIGDLLNPSAASGVLGPYATTGQGDIQAQAANTSGSAAKRLCFIS